MKSTSLVFFGSGPVGLESLKALQDEFEIELVVTKPDPKSSRAPRLVADYARQNDLRLIQPGSKNELTQTLRNAEITSRFGLVVDYGFIIEQGVIDLFELGIINSHFSLLPEWRGADPITFSLLSGQKETGVSLMRIDDGLDTGKLLAQSPYQIAEDETIDSLTDNLVALSNEMLKAILPDYLEGNIVLFDQDNSIDPTYSRKLTKEDGRINWAKPASQIEREIRAFSGWPGSFTTFCELDVTITGAAGQLTQPSKKELTVYCGEQALAIDRLKPAGKKEMKIADFLAGYASRLDIN